MAHSAVCSGAPAAAIAEASDRTSSARLTLGTTIPAGPAAHTAARSSSCHGEPSPLMRMVSSRIPYAPETAAAQASSRAAPFASGATASSRSRISPSTGRRLGLLESALVGRRQVEDRPPRADLAHEPASDAVRLGQLRVEGREALGEVEENPALLEAGVVLHPAVEHDRAGPVAHGRDDPARVRHVLRGRAEHPLRDGDLAGVQRPGADAAEQEGGAELVLAPHRVADVAERPVVRVDPRGGAGVDHPGDGVVPEVLLHGRPRRVGIAGGGVGADDVPRVAAADARRLHPTGGGEVGRAEATVPASGGMPCRSPRRSRRRGRSRGSRGRGSAGSVLPWPPAGRAAGRRSGCPRHPRPWGP